MTNETQPTKVFAKVKEVNFNTVQDMCTITFLASDNQTLHNKTLKIDMRGLEDVLDNLGVSTWQGLPTARGNVVQLALYDGQARYINKAEIKNGVCRAVWKAITPKAKDPNAFDFSDLPVIAPKASDIPYGTPPLPGVIGDAEGDKMFPDFHNTSVYALKVNGTNIEVERPAPSPEYLRAVADRNSRDANRVRFLKLSTDKQELALRLVDNLETLKTIINGGSK